MAGFTIDRKAFVLDEARDSTCLVPWDSEIVGVQDARAASAWISSPNLSDGVDH